MGMVWIASLGVVYDVCIVIQLFVTSRSFYPNLVAVPDREMGFDREEGAAT